MPPVREKFRSSRPKLSARTVNGAIGTSDVEGKVARVSDERVGKRTSFNGTEGISDMAGGSGPRLGRSVVAVEPSGSERDTMERPG
jgi:hypothetical protein